MGESVHHVNGVDICAATSGPADGEPLLMIMGLGGQRVSWDPRLIDTIGGRGFRVITFDNRDAGRSTHFDHHPIDLAQILTGETTAPYLLSDMAGDAAGLLESLGFASAHVMGISLGGMIAQQLVIDHPDKVRSVTSIMSTTGDPDVGQPTDAAVGGMLRAPATDEDEAVQAAVESDGIWGSPGFPDPGGAAARARREWNRVQAPDGVLRQLAAIWGSPSRTTALGDVRVPFTVIHGLDDELVSATGGARTASAVPHATHIEIAGMGHNLPEPLWRQIVDAIVATTGRAVPTQS